MDYYICNNDDPKGPFAETQLRAMWLNGSILATTLYWRDGMAEWRPIAELCDSKPLSADAKKIVNDAVQVMRPHCARALKNIGSVTNDAVQSVRSVYTSAERNISEFNNELGKAKAKPQQPDTEADAPQHFTPVQKLAQGLYAFFVRIDKTVTRVSLLREPPFKKHLIYAFAAFVCFIILGVIGFSLSGCFSAKNISYYQTGREIGTALNSKVFSGNDVNVIQSYTEDRLDEMERKELRKRGIPYPRTAEQKSLFNLGISETLYGP